MAVFRRAVSMALPRGGEVVMIEGRLTGVWRDRKGKRQAWPVVMAGEAPKQYLDGRVRVLYKPAQLYAKTGGVLVALGVRDKSAARTLETELAKRVDQAKAGMIPMHKVKDIRSRITVCTIEESIAAYIEQRRLAGLRPRKSLGSLRLRSEALGWRTIADMSGDQLTAWLNQSDMAVSTKAQEVATWRAFANWLVRSGKLDRSPFEAVSTRQHGDREEEAPHRHRALTGEELICLVRTAAEVSAARSLCWSLIATTGLRSDEAGQLLVSDIDLERRSVTIRAAVCKTRRTVTLPLRFDIAEALADHIRSAGLQSGDPVIGGSARRRIEHLKHDLKIAGIEYQTSAGFADVHGLRKTFASQLAQDGVHLSLVMHLMRHTPRDITSAVYISFTEADQRRAVDQLLGGQRLIPDKNHS
jgi:integrase